jgi:hypothetical protein
VTNALPIADPIPILASTLKPAMTISKKAPSSAQSYIPLCGTWPWKLKIISERMDPVTEQNSVNICVILKNSGDDTSSTVGSWTSGQYKRAVLNKRLAA